MSTYYNTNKANGFDMSDLDAPEYLRDFLNYEQIVINLAPRTIHAYYVSLRLFLRWLVCRDYPDRDPAKVDIGKIPFDVIEAVTENDILDFLVYCSYQRQNEPASRSVKLSALKAFFNYNSGVTGRILRDPAANIMAPKKEKVLPKYLTEAESAKLIKASEYGDNPKRNKCITVFFLNCGMRLTELTKINLSDIRDNSLIIRGKNRKERVLFLNSDVMEALDEYLEEKSHYHTSEADKNALFVSRRKGTRLTGRAIEKIIDKALLNAGLEAKGYSPHKLRHTAATLMYKKDVAGILELQEILGHASTQIVSTYAHIDSETVRTSMESFRIEEKDGPAGHPDTEAHGA